MDYDAFLAQKRATVADTGRIVSPADIHPGAKPHQRAIIAWACRKGRAAIFADTGLGKSLMLLEWARLIGERTLVLAPLSVARQIVREAAKWGIEARYVRDQAQATGGINVTNYEMLPHFDPAQFGAVVLDESSILKALDGETRKRLTAVFAETPYRLCCTATPAPNDIAEIGNHAEFLGVMSVAHMRARFFVHDNDKSQDWRLKGHASEAFYRWLASWAMSVRRPSDLGFDDTGYILPPLTVMPRWVASDYVPEGQLFFTELKGIQGRTQVRHGTLAERVAAAASLVNASDEPWLVWCGMNDEGDALTAAIPGAVQVTGSDTPERKAEVLESFQDGKIRVLVTKPRIAGFGMNFQHCARQVFVGLSDSFEAYYQCIRRSWRYGQQRPVEAHIVLSELEEAIYHNVMRKEADAQQMMERLVQAVKEYEQAEIGTAEQSTPALLTDEARGDGWRLLLGDSTVRLKELEAESIDLSIFSPPFASLYTYSPDERDLGNSADEDEFFGHFRYIIGELYRVTKPGRNVCVHVQQIAAQKGKDGYIGIKDFRGDVIRAFQDAGFVLHGEVTVDKDPQAQAIRTKAKGLLFVQLRKDSSESRPALADYLLKFQKPGLNAVPIQPDISNDDWIHWARPVWYGIGENDTLQYTTARDPEDERHICPLQLGFIERCVRLWSNAGETVLDPFNGIGSTGHVALKHGRKYIGIELKPSYYRIAAKNLRAAEAIAHAPTLFDDMWEDDAA
jgi:DNA modification methylase